MSRRAFLGWVGTAALPGCGPTITGRLSAPAPPAPTPPAPTPPAPASPQRLGAVAFDLFTLFDPRGVDQRVSAVVSDQPGFAATWKAKLFEYSWLRGASGQYVNFEVLVQDALSYAARAHRVTLSEAARAELESAFTELAPWPDSAHVLERLRARGLKLAPLANFAPRMIERLLGHSKLLDHFDAMSSTFQA